MIVTILVVGADSVPVEVAIVVEEGEAAPDSVPAEAMIAMVAKTPSPENVFVAFAGKPLN